MNQNNTEPASIKPAQTGNHGARATSDAELELGCVDLLSQIEVLIASARGDRNGRHVENAETRCLKLLEILLDFSEAHLTGDYFNASCEAIERAQFATVAHKQVLENLGWGAALKHLLGADILSMKGVSESYQKLGTVLLNTCLTVLEQASKSAGEDSQVATMINQSAAIVVEEFNSSW